MPELPEVETIRKALEKKIANKKIIDFHIGNKKLRFDLPEKFKQLVIGQTVMKPLRVGKEFFTSCQEYAEIVVFRQLAAAIRHRLVGRDPARLGKRTRVGIVLCHGGRNGVLGARI